MSTQDSTHTENQPDRPEVPLELHKLDDSVLVYSSEDGHIDQDDAADGESDHGDCHGEQEIDGVDTSPYLEVVFKGERRGYYLNADKEELREGQYVIVEAEKGVDLGVIGAIGPTAYMKSRLRMRPCKEEMKKYVRPATDADIKVLLFHREQELTAFQICLEKISKLDLPMKLVDVEYQFDRNRITFYFTADGRVDFRQLVRELAAEYRTRIELRQIGPRDEAKRMGGFGVCGRELCCSSWLGMFEPISTDMARLQNLTINPFKLAGQCGRLKCCLSYEAQLYEELLKRFPPLDYRLTTEKGEAKIEKIDIFQDAIYLHYQKDNGWERLTLDEVNVIINAPPKEQEADKGKNKQGAPDGKRHEGGKRRDGGKHREDGKHHEGGKRREDGKRHEGGKRREDGKRHEGGKRHKKPSNDSEKHQRNSSHSDKSK